MKIALGVFDGVHLGHLKVIERAHRVVTLHPHPNTGVHLLTTLAERRDLINNLEVIKFTAQVGHLTPEEFIRDIIVKRYRPEAICVGDDFAFGYNREGNVRTLKELGRKYGFAVEVVPEVDIKGEPVRSSRIRQLLGAGQVAEAAQLLGRAHALSGKVVRGRGVGRTLGFPTANIKVDKDKLVPRPGVYSGHIIVHNEYHPCAISIGEHETFETEHAIEVEAYIPGFSRNIYGRRITLFFDKFLRPQKKFKDKKALAAQIKKDVRRIK